MWFEGAVSKHYCLADKISMKFSYNWLQSFFEKNLPNAENLAELLTMHSFEVETIDRKGNDFVFDIDVTANRPDCFAHLGIAREISAILGFKLKELEIKLKETGKTKVDIDIQDKNDCPRYVASIIENIKVQASEKYIQERLRSCGVEPINNIVDSANYVMLETGQPLHIFDFDKIKGDKIIIRRAKKGEKITGLDENEYELDKDILVIADKSSAIAIAGIKGGKSTAVDKETKTILLEAANFNPVLIRRASKKLNLRTDASMRFEHNLDQELTIKAIDRLSHLIQGDVMKKNDKSFEKIRQRKLKLNLKKVQSILGIKISEDKAKKILSSLGLEMDSNLNVTIPSIRKDIQIQEDLVEEIGRIYGYQNLESKFPKLALVTAKNNENLLWQAKIKDFFKQNSFYEAYNYSFISKKIGDNFGGPLVEMENPYSTALYYLRPNLLLGLFENIRNNRKHYDKDLRIFEIGKTFRRIDRGMKETNILAVITAGETDNFYSLKGIVDQLLESLGISNIFYDSIKADPEKSKMLYWDLKQAAEIKVDGVEIGFLGAISDLALRHSNIKDKVLAIEIDCDKLIEFAEEENQYQPISKYPAAVRDIALLVPLDVKVVDVLNKINAIAGKILKDIDLFDMYEGEALPEGKKNLAFHLIFQAEDRTLSSKEIDDLQKKIINNLEKDPEWEVRK